MKFKKTEIAVAIAFVLVLFISNLNTLSAEVQEIRSNTLRLHIRANSDTEEDQALKLKVRDEITKQCAHLFTNAKNEEEAKQITKENLKEIEKVSLKVIKENGYNYKVKVQVVNMYFETRKYETFTMPAGYYDAVTVDIGSGEGKNWWCVLFPPLCVSPVIEPNQETQKEIEKQQDELLDKAFGEDQKELIKNGSEYEYKFALIEAWEKLKEKFS